jgi:hypothetical protein
MRYVSFILCMGTPFYAGANGQCLFKLGGPGLRSAGIFNLE